MTRTLEELNAIRDVRADIALTRNILFDEGASSADRDLAQARLSALTERLIVQALADVATGERAATRRVRRRAA